MLCHQGLDLLVDYDFVAIFDADFKPEPDFLVRLLLRAIVNMHSSQRANTAWIKCRFLVCSDGVGWQLPSLAIVAWLRMRIFHVIFLSQARLSRCTVAGAKSSCAGGAQTQTVPYLIDNPEVGYVQTRWVFVNPDESYLTKVGRLCGGGSGRLASQG